MTDITIVATTWLPPGKEKVRLEAFIESASSWSKNLKFSGNINLHVADDGTSLEHVGLFDAVLTNWDRGSVSFGQQDRRGVGASLNNGLWKAFRISPIALHAVDDWELVQSLDLDPWINFLLDESYEAGMVRFFPHPDLTGEVKHIPPYGWAFTVDAHHFAFGFRPCLWHKRLFDRIGYFKEKVSSLEAEYDFNDRVCRWNKTGIWLALPELWSPIETGSLAELIPA